MNHPEKAALGLVLASGLHCASVPQGDHDDPTTRNGTSAVREVPRDDTSAIESVVAATDGSRYVAGTFTGRFHAGDRTLASRGASDVFVMHVLGDGRVAWARGIGSEVAETGPNIVVDGGTLTLVAMTEGSVDCGAGALRNFDGETFFVCAFDTREGEVLSGGAFPTGRR